jgi:2-polyprenyl-6-methoxyphenol hydroxylase-like FAD-dependent oxidoreductase
MQNVAQVLIVGAGPVGLTLAIDLGRRGVDCLLIEAQSEPRRLPKMERLNARSMEIYRRLGLAGAIREAGAPMTARMDVLVARNMAEEPLVRFDYGSAADAQAAIAACRDGSLPLEAPHLVSQYTLEPLLMAEARKCPTVRVQTGCTLLSFEQDETGVTAKVEYADGRTEEIRAQYMVGTDGGRSTVRKALGIALQGDGGLAKKNQVFVRCDRLWEVCPFPQSRMILFTNADQSILSLQDSLRHFVFHTSCWGDEAQLRAQIRTTLALDVEFDILSTMGWTLHLLLAERYRDRRVFLAGDSAHLVIPTGGLGLNTGIGDAIDLSWKLAATLQGWGGPWLLDAYDAERRAVGARNVAASRYAVTGQQAWRAAVRPCIGENTPEGRGVRAAVARLASVEQRKTHEQVGTELGYRYESSPIVLAEQGTPPPDVREVYIPTSRPGARLPHMWTGNGQSVHDRVGAGYCLLRLGAAAEGAEALTQAFRELGTPLQLLDLDDMTLRDAYGADLLLLRPDLHVCWRGARVPPHARDLASVVTGRTAHAAWSREAAGATAQSLYF